MGREYPEAPVVAVGVVVRRGDEVLLVRRGREPYRGQWNIPGGVVELGETLGEAARREVEEECGIRVRAGGVVGVAEVIERGEEGRVRFHYVIVDLVAVYAGGSLRAASDVLEARWVHRDELFRFSLPERVRKVIERAFEAR